MKTLKTATLIFLLSVTTLAQTVINGSRSYAAGQSANSMVTNEGTTGTTLNKLAKLTGAPGTAIITATGDTTSIHGIVTSGAGTTGSAHIARVGQASCVFDGATTSLDYFQNSATVAGDCHDAGTTCPTSGQVLGRVLSTNGSGGTFVVSLGVDGCSGAAGAPVGAHYVTTTADSTLTNEVLITPADNLQRLAAEADTNAGPYTINFNPLDVTTVYEKDEFISSTSGELGGWATSTIGGAPTTSMQGIASPHLGVVKVATTAVSAQGGCYQLTQSSTGLLPLSTAVFDSSFIFSLQQTVTQTFFIGFTSQCSATPANFIGLRFDTTQGTPDTNFMAVSTSSSTTTATSLAVAVDTAWHKIRVRADVAGTIKYSLDGGSDVTITTNVPSANLWPVMIIVTQAASGESSEIDFFGFKVRGLTR